CYEATGKDLRGGLGNFSSLTWAISPPAPDTRLTTLRDMRCRRQPVPVNSETDLPGVLIDSLYKARPDSTTSFLRMANRIQPEVPETLVFFVKSSLRRPP